MLYVIDENMNLIKIDKSKVKMDVEEAETMIANETKKELFEELTYAFNNGSYLHNAYKNEILWVIEDIINDEFENETYKNNLKNIKDDDLTKIADMMLNDNELNEELNNTIRYYLGKYFNKKESK